MSNSISIYIHIPFCLSKCSYCDFFSIPCKCISDDYIAAVCNEIDFRIKKLPEISEIKTVYIGGGTPSLLKADQFKKLSNHLSKYIKSFDDIEFSVEVNPDDVTESLLKTLENCGVNRISCGIQSMNDKSLSSVNRRTDSQLNNNALETFRKNWSKKLSFDLIAGLPYETHQSFEKGVKTVINANPDHISLYTLTVEEGTVLSDKIENCEIEYDFDFNDKLWLLGKELLEKSGYNHYEVSNFSKTGFECKHNLTYWKHDNYLGIGSGGTGTIYGKNGCGFRWTNAADISKYTTFWNKDFIFIHDNDLPEGIQNSEVIDKENSIFEFFMMGLRTKFGVNSIDFESIFSEKMPDSFIKLITEWKNKDFARIIFQNDNTNYSLNEKGILFLNKFLEDLDI